MRVLKIQQDVELRSHILHIKRSEVPLGVWYLSVQTFTNSAIQVNNYCNYRTDNGRRGALAQRCLATMRSWTSSRNTGKVYTHKTQSGRIDTKWSDTFRTLHKWELCAPYYPFFIDGGPVNLSNIRLCLTIQYSICKTIRAAFYSESNAKSNQYSCS
jgi:hypothetical protein